MFIICPYISIIKYFLHLPILQIPIEYHRIPAYPSDPSASDKAGRGLGKGQESQEEHISEDLRADYMLITCTADFSWQNEGLWL